MQTVGRVAIEAGTTRRCGEMKSVGPTVVGAVPTTTRGEVVRVTGVGGGAWACGRKVMLRDARDAEGGPGLASWVPSPVGEGGMLTSVVMVEGTRNEGEGGTAAREEVTVV